MTWHARRTYVTGEEISPTDFNNIQEDFVAVTEEIDMLRSEARRLKQKLERLEAKFDQVLRPYLTDETGNSSLN